MQRRTFFGIVGAGAASLALPLGPAFVSARERTIGSASSSGSPSLDWLFAPLALRPLPGGFRVVSISPIERGSVAISLARQDGVTASVQVFRRSPLSSGLATTRLLDLRVMNGADGEAATHEASGVAVMQLASRLRRIEASSLRQPLAPAQRSSLRALHTHEQRVALYGGFRREGVTQSGVDRA